MVPAVSLPDATYARLLLLRSALRRFERWSEDQARAAGLSPAQHQLLLSIRGHSDPRGPTVGDVAEYLLLRHHSVVGLVDRAVVAGLVTRARDEDDHRLVRLRLTKKGARRLERLAELHLEELRRLAPQLSALSKGLPPVLRVHGGAAGASKIARARIS
jgi:DNA-binding MarR family transcriptional regulator